METNEFDFDEKNNSVVGRAYHFVKNIFQLSDDILESNQSRDDDSIVLTSNEQQQQRHPTRKLLSLNQWHSKFFDLYFHDFEEPSLHVPAVDDDFSFASTRLAKRQLLSVKTSKRVAPAKLTSKEKRAQAAENKPRVGWAYRYRISRYLADQKGRRAGAKSRQSNAKGSKRKLLGLDSEDESSLKDM